MYTSFFQKLFREHIITTREQLPNIISQLVRSLPIYVGKSFVIIVLRENGVEASIIANAAEGLIGASLNSIGYAAGSGLQKDKIIFEAKKNKLILKSFIPASTMAIITTILAFTVASENDSKISLLLLTPLAFYNAFNNIERNINFVINRRHAAFFGLTRGFVLLLGGGVIITLEACDINVKLWHVMIFKNLNLLFNTMCYYTSNLYTKYKLSNNKQQKPENNNGSNLDIGYIFQITLPAIFNVLICIKYSRMPQETKDAYGYLSLWLTSIIRILNAIVYGGFKCFNDKDIDNKNDQTRIAKNTRVLYINTMLFGGLAIYGINYSLSKFHSIFQFIMGAEQSSKTLKIMSTIMSPLCFLMTLRQVSFGVARICAGKNSAIKIMLIGGEIIAFVSGTILLYKGDFFSSDPEYKSINDLFSYIIYAAASNIIHSGFVFYRLALYPFLCKEKGLEQKISETNEENYQTIVTSKKLFPVETATTTLEKFASIAKRLPCCGAVFLCIATFVYRIFHSEPKICVSIQQYNSIKN